MNILLTRPLLQVSALQSMVNDNGHQSILFPTLEIKALKATPLHQQYNAVIFISANAVEYGVTILEKLNLNILNLVVLFYQTFF